MLINILLEEPHKCISSLKILNKLGEGSNGTVHHTCILNKCKYILKVINYQNTKNLKYILNEINTQHILSKKYPSNIPYIKSFFMGDATINNNVSELSKDIKIKKKYKYVYVIMEYLENKITLTTYLNILDKNNNISKSYKLLKQIVNLITQINNSKIIHGDLHTDNIMVDKDGKNFHLIDFGYSVNYKLKNIVNINNIPEELLYTFDLWKIVYDINLHYNVDENILKDLLIPSVSKYIKKYEKSFNYDDMWYTVDI